MRRYFLYDRKLLADLSRYAWDVLKVFLQTAVSERNPAHGAAITIQTFGYFLGFNFHWHILVTDDCSTATKTLFRIAPPLELKKMETIFQHKGFKMIMKKGKITKEMIAMLSWWHSGFHAFCDNRISSDNDAVMVNLARYIIWASFSQERMQ